MAHTALTKAFLQPVATAAMHLPEGDSAWPEMESLQGKSASVGIGFC